METMKEYKRGLLYFGSLMICICLLFTTPDGVSIYYGLLGLIGINPGIPIGSNSTLYIYGIVPLALIIICIKKVLAYWRGYGMRFKELNVFLRLLPLLVVMLVIMLSNVVQPSLLDRMYFAMLSQRSGLHAISFYSADDNLRYRFTANNRTFTYSFALGNHGDEDLEFHMLIFYQDKDGEQNVYFSDEHGDAKLFVLAPQQLSNFSGDFTVNIPTHYDSGSGSSVFSVILLNEDGQHKPVRLIRCPIL